MGAVRGKTCVPVPRMRPIFGKHGPFCTAFRPLRRTIYFRSSAPFRAQPHGFPMRGDASQEPGVRTGQGRALHARPMPCFSEEVSHERPVDLSGIPRNLLELQTCAQVSGQAGGAASAGAHDGGHPASGGMEKAPRGHQCGAPPRPRPGLGRRGDAERHAHPARLAGSHRGALPRARPAHRRRRPHRQQPVGGRAQDGPRGHRRGRGADCRLGSGPGARHGQARLSSRRTAGDDNQPAARPEPDQDAPLLDHGRAILARLPLQLRVLRHHRDLRPASAHQGRCPGTCRAGPVIRGGMARGGVYRRRQLHRQQGARQGVMRGARPMAQPIQDQLRLPH